MRTPRAALRPAVGFAFNPALACAAAERSVFEWWSVLDLNQGVQHIGDRFTICWVQPLPQRSSFLDFSRVVWVKTRHAYADKPMHF